MNKRLGTLALAAACLALGGCSKELTRSRAADLIEKNAEFGAPAEVKIPVGTFWWDYRNLSIFPAPLTMLTDMNILTVRGSGQKDCCWQMEYIAELTAHGKDVSTSWTETKDRMLEDTRPASAMCYVVVHHPEPCHNARGKVYSQVVARRKIIEVTGITGDQDGQSSQAEFDWRWIASSEAKVFGITYAADAKKGQATFRHYDDGWRMVNIALK
jgi:hypothetical protein